MAKGVTNQQFSRRQLAVFAESMGMMLRGGYSPAEAVAVIAQDQPEGSFRDTLHSLSIAIDDLYSPWKAMQGAGCFPRYFIDMVRVGETTGKLEKVFFSLATYYEKETELEERVKGVITYPLIIILIMAAIVFFLIVAVLPIFRSVFERLAGTLTGGSFASVNLGFTIAYISFGVIVLLLLALLALAVASKIKKGTAALVAMLERLPLTGELSYQMAASRLSYALAAFLSAGLNTDESMELAGEMTTQHKLRAKVLACTKHLAEGQPLGEAIAKENIFGSLYGRMLVSGMRGGAADVAMARLADIYEQDTREAIDHFISAIVPISAAAITIIIGAVLVAVMLPLVGIMTALV